MTEKKGLESTMNIFDTFEILSLFVSFGLSTILPRKHLSFEFVCKKSLSALDLEHFILKFRKQPSELFSGEHGNQFLSKKIPLYFLAPSVNFNF